jgi:hypothetical protein
MPRDRYDTRPASSRCSAKRDAGIATSAPVASRDLVVGVYTSSQVEKFGDALPVGVSQVPAERATRSGDQLPFFIDVRQASVPELDQPGSGVIAPADKGLLKETFRQYRLINERHPEAIVNVGPLRP